MHAASLFRRGLHAHRLPGCAARARGLACSPRQDGAKGKRMTIRVFIVDDHALVRAGMSMILSSTDDI